MRLEIRRVVVFVRDMEVQARFYREVLGLPLVLNPDDEAQFVEFEAGGCRLALHSGGLPSRAKRPTKLVFYAQDVAAARAWLASRGAKLGKVKSTAVDLADGSRLQLCDGQDPEGNPFQLSNRV
ncbi:MAG: VOC family protein [Meiothermus sp.]|nr:VOC family protein [Meiothermus sp.]